MLCLRRLHPPYIYNSVNVITGEYTERKNLICRRELPEGRYQSIEYQDGKVKHLKGPVGLDESPVITHRFVYHEGYTEVFDALDHKTIYRFGDNQRLTVIEMYNQQGQLYRKELYDWDDQKRLVRKALEDGNGQLHVRHTFAYNDQGNVIQHTMHGNLTGNNSNECYSTYYHYSEDGNQLLSCTEDNGSRKRFLYDNERLVATFTLDKGCIRIREFYTYNQDGDLIQTILDNGNSEDSDDLSTFTERHITNIIGDAVEEKYWDFSDNREVLLKRTVNTYSDTHKLIQRDIFDADGVYRHSLYRDYDEKGRLITEIDPQGKTTYTSYDANGNILSHTSDEKQSTYSYDFSNRLIRMKENEKECKIVESHRYDAGGNHISTIDIFGNETHFEYDAFGRAIKSIYPDGSSTSCEYDIFDRMTKRVDPRGYTTITRYNIRGKPIEIIYPDNTNEKYEYNFDGSLRKHIAKDDTYTIYDRDYLSRVVKQEWYNSEGKLECTLSSTYNAFHLIFTSDYTTYTYDGAGRKIEKIKNDRMVEFEYDALGRLHLQKEEEACIYFEYDAKDNLKEMRMYDVSGNIINKETMEEKPEPHRVYHYDDVLQIIMTNEHGIITETTFDKMSRIETIVKNNPMKFHGLYGLFSFSDLCDQFISYAVTINQYPNNTIATLQHHLSFSNYIYPEITRLGEKIFGKSLLSFAGFYQDQSEIGVYGKGELIDNVRITMINGILTSRYDYKLSLEKLSETHGGMNIHYVFHATDGWTWDLLKATLIKYGYFSPHAYELAETWKALIEEMGGPEGGGTIIHYAHSIGAVDTHHAKTLLTPEEQKMIHVITIGSATMLEDTGFGSVINYASKRDGVSYLDPIGFIKGLLGSDETIMVGSWLGFPLIDHPLLMDTYTELIEKLGEQFVRRYGL